MCKVTVRVSTVDIALGATMLTETNYCCIHSDCLYVNGGVTMSEEGDTLSAVDGSVSEWPSPCSQGASTVS